MKPLSTFIDNLQAHLARPDFLPPVDAKNKKAPISAAETPEARKIMEKLAIIFKSTAAAKAAGIDFDTFADKELRRCVSGIVDDVLRYQQQ